MIYTKDISMESFIHTVLKEQSPLQEQTLISWTEEMKEVDLLTVFQNALQTKKQRLFWMNSSNTFSFVGVGCIYTLVAEKERYNVLKREWRELLDKAFIHNPFKNLGTGLVAVGGMSFDPKRKKSDLWENFPTSQLTIPEIFVVHANNSYFITVNKYIEPNESLPNIIHEMEQLKSIASERGNKQKRNQKIVYKEEVEPELWKQTVQKAVEQIKQNEASKIVLAREMQLTLNKDACITSLLKKLINSQTNSYIFAIEHGAHCFIGATPERLVQISNKELLSTCLAGTAPRGKTKEIDEKIGCALLNDQKNREEHDYVVQMIKNSIAPYCYHIDIPDEPILYPLKNLQHLYTPVKATLKESYTVFDIIEQLHPTPALGGVPREKSLAFIREHELLDRGWYGSPIGWLDSNGNSEFVVAIRSGLVKGRQVSLFAGCGVMRDSDPQMEYDETNIKFLPMLQVLED